MADNLPPSESVTYSNSKKSKDGDRPAVKPIVLGNVSERKKPLGRRFVELFGGDDAKSVGEYLLEDVFVPAIKNLISETFSQGVDRLLFGGTGGSRSRSRVGDRGGYSTMYTGGPRKDERNDRYAGKRPGVEYGDILFESRGDAEQVIDSMIAILQDYKTVSRADLLSLLDRSPSHMDHKWGWTDLRSAGVRRIREGYLLALPPVEDID